jgi:hypothetical protein
MPDTPTAETAVTIAQIMSLIIRPCYPRYGRPAVQNCTEHMEKCLAKTHESPLVRFIDSGGSGGLIALLAWEKSSGSGSARLGLSQKGGLPFPSETPCSKRRFKAADAR